MLDEPLPMLNIGLASLLPLAGVIAGWVAMTWLAERRGVAERVGPARRVGDVLFWASIAALVAGRLGAVLPDAEGVLRHPVAFIRINAGLSLWGTVAGFTVAGWWLCRRWGVDFPRLADAVALFAAIPVVLGRASCLGVGYCGGRPADAPFGITVPGATIARYPSDLYEAVIVVALALALRWAVSLRAPSGSLALLFLSLYGVTRALVALTRADAGAVPLVVDQALSLAIAAAAGIVLAVRSARDAGPVETRGVDAPPPSSMSSGS